MPTCADSVKNGVETDVDCGGGTCPPCTSGKLCRNNSDCATLNCANGICSNPFLEHAFRTDEFRIRVRINDNGTWTYEQDTILKIHGQDELFHHKDRNTLSKIGEPTPNPLAREK